MLRPSNNGERYDLETATEMPRAAGFLWNSKMMIQVNCRGYVVSQYMSPEPAKYAYAPNLEAKTFMQPEQPYYAHHPGRFVYIKDEETGELFSAPYEPVRADLNSFNFSVGKSDILWQVEKDGIQVELKLSIPKDDVLELWSVSVKNTSGKPRKLSVYPYFPTGYMSWMNQSGLFNPDLNGIVCTCVTPYQKYPDYFKTIKHLKDKTFFLGDKKPTSWEVQQELFEGEGGLHNPTGTSTETLTNSDAVYETPAGILQYRCEIPAGESQDYKFIFGPAKDETEIEGYKARYLDDTNGFEEAHASYDKYVRGGEGFINIETPDEGLDNFVNHWLGRQVFYHGDVNRLSTDPQTRNYLQDNMGMSYIKPEVTRAAFLLALSQQKTSGAMPDGILIHEEAELKYINQVPHTDHCVWLPVCLRTYLDETNDYAMLEEVIPFEGGAEPATAFEHISRAMNWLLSDRDERGLNFIAQGDWCDPMNMVGYKGKGVSGWLTLATAYALNLWADVCDETGRPEQAVEFRAGAQACNDAANTHIWDKDWYGRGITDDNVLFGTEKDAEGRIFLNPQGWALLSGAADEKQKATMIKAVEDQLETPYGVAMLAPAFTAMREDVGRVTQKHPGSAENGSIYNHAAAFYIYGLYSAGENERAFKILRQMIPGPDSEDYLQRGQLPVFIPNYYRGAYYQFPRTAGRSSQLFNTGTVHWFYRCVIDGLFGLRGSQDGLRVEPNLPSDWPSAKVSRKFRGAMFEVDISREKGLTETRVTVDGNLLSEPTITDIETGKTYQVVVSIPA